jgi:hypothetical protein
LAHFFLLFAWFVLLFSRGHALAAAAAAFPAGRVSFHKSTVPHHSLAVIINRDPFFFIPGTPTLFSHICAQRPRAPCDL